MARLVKYSRRLGRYRVVDDTISTWKIVDTETGETVKAAMQHYEASLLADELNAGVVDPDEID